MNNVLKLKSLTFKNFRSFVEEQTISFEDRSQLVQVDGVNEDTGGSSGAGKTTIFLALDFLFDISEIPATALQSWHTKEKIYVKGVFEIDGEEIIITRTNQTGNIYTIETPKETISGSAALAKEKIQEIIKIPKDLFKKMIHKKQKEGGFFLNLTPKEMYNFLIQVLGLELYNQKVDLIDSDVKRFKEDSTKLNIELQNHNDSLNNFKELKDAQQKPTCTCTEESIKPQQDAVDQIKSQISEMENKLQQELQAIAITEPVKTIPDTEKLVKGIALLDTKISEVNAEKVLLKKQLDDKNKEINESIVQNKLSLQQCNTAEIKINELKTLILKNKEEQSHIESNTCPTCKNKWVGDSATQKIGELKQTFQVLATDIIKNKKILDQKDVFVENISLLEQQILSSKAEFKFDDLDNKLTTLNETKNNLNNSIKNAQNEADKEFAENINKYNQHRSKLIEKYSTSELKSQKETIEREILLATNTMQNYNDQLNKYNLEQERLEKLIFEHTRKVACTQEELQNIDKKLSVAEETKRLIKSFVLSKFEDTLTTIGDMATDLLTGIPNMKNASIYFNSSKETKSGKVKDEVSGMLNKGNMQDVPIKAISGGERTAIDLAVDFAVIDTIEKQSGVGADFFIIDEPFDGLDSVNRENCLEVLQQLDTTKKIILVDHSEELKQIVSDVIKICKKNDVSTVE